MGTLYGSEYEQEIDAIHELALEHLQKYGAYDYNGALERIFGAVRCALVDYADEKTL
jgi:hypothetical protein